MPKTVIARGDNNKLFYVLCTDDTPDDAAIDGLKKETGAYIGTICGKDESLGPALKRLLTNEEIASGKNLSISIVPGCEPLLVNVNA